MPERNITLTCRHYWDPTETGFACTDCGAETHSCNTCNRPADTANNACTRCINRYHQTLADIDHALDHPRAPILHLKATRYDATTRTGGDPMPFGIGQELDDPEVLKTQLQGTKRTVLELTRNPKTLGDTIKDWANMWAEHHDHTLQGNPTAYLRKMAIWASNNPGESGWHDHWKEIHNIRKRLFYLVGLNPQYEPTPCVVCGAPLKREWTDNGLTDTILCVNRKCERRVYRDEEDLAWMNRDFIQKAPKDHPDSLLTREQIRIIYPKIKPGTLRKWISEGELQPISTDERGKDQYQLEDVTRLYERAY